MLANKLMSALSGAEEKLYVDDVFSAYTRTGTGADVTVPTGIDMTKGYMLWSKGRSGATDHAIYDSARGLTYDLASNTAAAQTTQATGLKAVSATGHTIGSLAKMNTSAATYVDFVFRKAPKFFDVVTWVGNGVSGRQIPHALGQEVGVMLVKNKNSALGWQVYHRSLANTEYMVLNSTEVKATGATRWNSTTPTNSGFRLGTDLSVNALGSPYIAYLFAHDPDADGIIQCGSFTTDASGNATVTLGWEPQYLLLKNTQTSGYDWEVYDSTRGMTVNTSASAARLRPNLSDSEGGLVSGPNPNAVGFTVAGGFGGSQNVIYLAIRRPNKPPTTGTQVYNGYTYTGNGVAGRVLGTEIVPDMVIANGRNSGSTIMGEVVDRLRGGVNELRTTGTGAEVNYYSFMNFDHMGVKVGAVNAFNENTSSSMLWAFKRAHGFFDIVCYTGTGSNRTVNHSLGVAPELMIVKKRNALNDSDDWQVYAAPLSANGYLWLNSTMAYSAAGIVWSNTEPNSTLFTVGPYGGVNQNTTAYVAYLFASLPGVSKVGSYTGNGSSHTINCGFSAGARFVLIKRTNAAGDWYIWDTARGIISANDPHLSLNTTAAEVTTNDSIDPDASGFIVNQVATTKINVSGGQYIFLAIA